MKQQTQPTTGTANTSRRKGPRRAAGALPLSLNVDLINRENEEAMGSHSSPSSSPSSCCFQMGDTTFRDGANGISIGRDYLRLEGTTVGTRGQLWPETLTVLETIGRGAFSTVQRAIWESNSISDADNNQKQMMEVAVKTFSLLDDSDSSSKARHRQREMLIKELRTLVCSVDCPSLVRLHGAFLRSDTDVVTVVLEYMDRGSLRSVLERTTGPLLLFPRNSVSSKSNKSQQQAPSSSLIAAIAYQMLLGLAYLHQDDLRFIHRDLKSDNVLLNSEGAVKLCDFGTSSLTTATSSLNTTVLGTAKFMAPERLRAQPYGRSSDLWSFGLVLVECANGTPPWSDVTSIVDLLVTVEEADANDLLLPVGGGGGKVEDGLREIVLACLQKDAAKRMPAKLLLKSPWFRANEIQSLESAMERTKDLFASSC